MGKLKQQSDLQLPAGILANKRIFIREVNMAKCIVVAMKGDGEQWARRNATCCEQSVAYFEAQMAELACDVFKQCNAYDTDRARGGRELEREIR